ISADLKKRGFKFVGPVTAYSFMQAIGLINDHEIECMYNPG
ncbi:DNA-3-methyladenine glycosylase I, partial [Enterococcus faecium]|nr:DNA-3-methyladenine glycosylase I [Enterococcus faecium]